MNQTASITRQLEYGARAFMLDVWDWNVNGVVDIICSHGRPVDGQSYTTLDKILGEITAFFAARPQEAIVVALLLEDYVDEYRNDPSRWVLLQDKLANTGCYLSLDAATVATQGWPDITTSKIVAFAQNYRPYGGRTSTIPNMYDLCVETVYGSSSTNHNTWNLPRNESNPMTGSAKAAGISVDNTLAIVNHFPSDPLWLSSDYAGNYNSLKTLNPHLDTLIWNNNRIPNFLAINFVDTGDGAAMLARWNGFNDNFRYPHWMPWIAPGDLNFAEENMAVVPNGQFITVIEGLNRPGHGLINLRVWSASSTVASTPITPKVNFTHPQLGSGWMTPHFDGQQPRDVLSLSVDPGNRFGAMIGCWMSGSRFALVNIVVPGAQRPDGTALNLTNNESLNADKVGPDGLGKNIFYNNDNIRAFHIRYSGEGVRDMRYAYE
jgi:hypothetical protein